MSYCKVCGTVITQSMLQEDGSIICSSCGAVYRKKKYTSVLSQIELEAKKIQNEKHFEERAKEALNSEAFSNSIELSLDSYVAMYYDIIVKKVLLNLKNGIYESYHDLPREIEMPEKTLSVLGEGWERERSHVDIVSDLLRTKDLKLVNPYRYEGDSQISYYAPTIPLFPIAWKTVGPDHYYTINIKMYGEIFVAKLTDICRKEGLIVEDLKVHGAKDIRGNIGYFDFDKRIKRPDGLSISFYEGVSVLVAVSNRVINQMKNKGLI